MRFRYEKNKEIIRKLLQLLEIFLEETKNLHLDNSRLYLLETKIARTSDYQILFECIVGLLESSNQDKVEEKAKQLLKEYSVE